MTVYGVAPQPTIAWFDTHLVGETLSYTLDISANIVLGTDILSTVSAQIAPSGTGEMTATALTVVDDLLTLTVTGGQPTRIHTIRFTAVTTGGRTYQFIVKQMVAATLPTDQAPAAPSEGFGTAVTWTNTPITAAGLVATLPANAVLRAIYIQNTTGNAITGGLNIGSTSNGSDIAAAIAVAANALVSINTEALLKQWFSASAPQPIYFSAGSAWNGAALNVRIVYDV